MSVRVLVSACLPDRRSLYRRIATRQQRQGNPTWQWYNWACQPLFFLFQRFVPRETDPSPSPPPLSPRITPSPDASPPCHGVPLACRPLHRGGAGPGCWDWSGSAGREKLDETYPGKEKLDETYPGREKLDETYPGKKKVDETYRGKEKLDETYPGKKKVDETYPGKEKLDETYPGKEKLDETYLWALTYF